MSRALPAGCQKPGHVGFLAASCQRCAVERDAALTDRDRVKAAQGERRHHETLRPASTARAELAARGVSKAVRAASVVNERTALELPPPKKSKPIRASGVSPSGPPDPPPVTKRASSRSAGRRSVEITVNGETKSQTEWARVTGLPVNTLKARIDRGMSPEEAVLDKDRRRDGRSLTVNGETLSLNGWHARTGVPSATIGYRLRAGLPPEIAVGLAPLPDGFRCGVKSRGPMELARRALAVLHGGRTREERQAAE